MASAGPKHGQTSISSPLVNAVSLAIVKLITSKPLTTVLALRIIPNTKSVPSVIY
jgi:hypothetical protein